MPSGRRSRRRSFIWLLLVALVVLAGAAFVRATLLEGAADLLASWEQSGLPGEAPTGAGPSFAFAWPPEVGWSDIRWVDPYGGESTCQWLRLRLSLESLVRGKLRFDSVKLTDLDLSLEPRTSRWAGLGLGVLPDTVVENELMERPVRGALRVMVESVRLGAFGPTVESIDGWVWSVRRGTWGGQGWARIDPDRCVALRMIGGGSRGSREATVTLASPAGPSLRFAWRQPVDQSPSWQLSGDGLGPLLLSILPIDSGGSRGSGSSSVSFRLSEEKGGEGEGEIHFEEFPLDGDSGDAIRGTGTICFGGGGITLEECALRGSETDVDLRVDLPTVSGGVPGHCLVSGTWRGQPLKIEGSIALVSTDGLRLAIDTASKGAIESGPADLRVLWREERPGRARMGGVALTAEGTVQIGGGTLRLRHARAERGSIAFALETDRVPLEDLAAWLPFSLPGTWSGLLNADGDFRLLRGGWVSSGEIGLHDGSVEDLPFLHEILEQLPSGFGRTTLRFDSLATRWKSRPGAFLADELHVDGRELTVEGSVFYAEGADSVTGLLRVRPAADRLVGQLLRLLGERKAGIDFILTGRSDAIRVSLPDDRKRDAMLEEMVRVREQWPEERP